MEYKAKVISGLLFLFILSSMIFAIYGDLLWFETLGYEQVFMRILFANLGIGLAAFIGFFAFALLNIRIARFFSLHGRKGKKSGNRAKSGIIIFLSLFLAFLVGMGFAKWEIPLKYFNAVEFGLTDPVFNMDIGFYFFKLPFYVFIYSFLIITVVLTMVVTILSYLTYSNAVKKLSVSTDFVDEIERPVHPMSMYHIDWSLIKDKCIPHMSFLFAVFLFLISFGFFLARYSILFSKFGVVYGAGFTDLYINLPFFTLMSVVSMIIGLLFLANIKIRNWSIALKGILVLIVIGVLGFLVSGAVQAFIVLPNEFNVEKPYIERNIENTLAAYNLNNINERLFTVSYNLTAEDVRRSNTIKNVRIWDWRPLKQTYVQLQLFRTYYDFYDVDIDRYNINGEYRQVMVSPREINVENLQSQAKTWVNKHLVYTHGYGVVMNPVNEVSPEGLPEFLIKDIPPKSNYFDVKQPEIYFGEGPHEFIIVKTTTEEFNYPSGEQNIYTTYTGSAGVELSNIIRRFIYASKFGSIELLVSSSIKPESRILMYRNIKERINKIAPFLIYDDDPYIVIANGRIYWIIDAYTVSNMYPYSEPTLSTRGIFNYIRNSVKVVVDAYNGDVKYYIIDDKDPIILTYKKIFPELFEQFSEMPAELKKHIRYPEGLFTVQARIYSTYHMRDPNVFYNKEDVWEIPDEIYRGNRQKMIPYYIIMNLPGKEQDEFIIMIPFTPRGKENMIGWMAARCDEPNYGDIIVFRFSKQELIYGPMQIEARIDQDTDISQKITLWSQYGSSVVRGNTLVIPIDSSILYIEPLYLEATERGTLPQLKRIIVAYGNKLTMKETLEDALNEIFGSPIKEIRAKEIITLQQKLTKISELYRKAQEALKKGDFSQYGKYISEMEKFLN
jgi:hypothetical protein